MSKSVLSLIAVFVVAGLGIALNASIDGGRPAHAQGVQAPPDAATGGHPCAVARTAKCADCDKCADCAADCPRAGAGVAGAPVEVTPENAKAWNELEGLMLKRHRAMWEYYTLLGAEKPDEAALKAKADEIRGIAGEMMLVHKSLRAGQSVAGPGCGAAGAPAVGGCSLGRGIRAGGCGAGAGCAMGAQ